MGNYSRQERRFQKLHIGIFISYICDENLRDLCEMYNSVDVAVLMQ